MQQRGRVAASPKRFVWRRCNAIALHLAMLQRHRASVGDVATTPRFVPLPARIGSNTLIVRLLPPFCDKCAISVSYRMVSEFHL